jgi:hypothetical protein
MPDDAKDFANFTAARRSHGYFGAGALAVFRGRFDNRVFWVQGF